MNNKHTYHTNTMRLHAQKGEIYILPIGGCSTHGIGMNMTIYACKTNNEDDTPPKSLHDLITENYKFIIVDVGITFGEKGTELIMPDVSCIKDLMHACEGVIITHAHEDHVGALAYLYRMLKEPKVYTTPFTSRIAEAKLCKFFGKSFDKTKINIISNYNSFKVGVFELSFFPMEHSIPDANALMINTRYGRIFHTGDWKGTVKDLKPEEEFDTTGEIIPSMIDFKMDYKKLSEINKADNKRTLAVVCDSTRIFNHEASKSEEDAYANLKIEIAKVKNISGTIFVSCFSSNVKRVISIMKAAIANGRTPILLGRSMEEFQRNARAEGYITDEMYAQIIPNPRKAKIPAANKRLVICTGSQGENNAAIHRMAHGKHDCFKIEKEDFVLFSSKTIPGNERKVEYILSVLTLKGVPYVLDNGTHVSGHPGKPELKALYSAVKAKYVVPVHGSSRQIEEHRRYAVSLGYQSVGPHNGDLIVISEDGIKKIEDAVFTGRCTLDGREVIPITSQIFKIRENLYLNGSFFVSITIEKSTKELINCQISQLGVKNQRHRILLNLKNSLYDEVRNILMKLDNEHRSTNLTISDEFIHNIASEVKHCITNIAERQINKRPMIEVHVSAI